MEENEITALKRQINELSAELNSQKKYGLVWDKEKVPERVVQECEKKIPVLAPSSHDFALNAGITDNLLIEGDNYHSLVALNYILRNTIDAIYIDPPYNTGERDFIYNDNYVDKEDGYRHSKWLTFMQRRLCLARTLLKDDGVLFVSIGDDEVNNIGLLLASIFGEQNFIGLLPRIGKKSGKTTTTIAKNHDYVYIYTKNKDLVTFAEQANDRDEKNLLKDEFYEERGAYRLNQCLDYDSLTYGKSMDYPLTINGETFYPGGSKKDWERRQAGEHGKFDWTWRWSPAKVDFGLKNGFIVIKNGKRKRIYTKTYTKVSIVERNGSYTLEKFDDTKAFNSLVFTDNKYSNDNAKKEFASFGIDEKFDFPKPSSLIKTCLQMIPKKDMVVLDFFAGSGTTGQATLELNKEDGGNRRFILCTNNENGICENITYQRIKTVITGKKVDGTKFKDPAPGNLYFFKTAFVDDSDNTDQAKYNLVSQLDPLLCIQESVFLPINRTNYSSHYSTENGKRHLFIYNDYFNDERMKRFKEDVAKAQGEKIVYIYSEDNEVDESLFEDIPECDVRPIPEKIYEIYKQIVAGIKRGE